MCGKAIGISMSKGLEKILKKIREHPNRKVLRERYLALVSEIESPSERQARMLDLGNVYFNIDPSESMQIAHQVYRQNKKSIKALKLIKLCLDKLGRKGKAEVIDNEIKKLKAEEESDDLKLPPFPSSEIGSEDKTAISESKEPGLPPLPADEETNITFTDHSSNQEATEYSPSFAISSEQAPSFEGGIPLAPSKPPDYTTKDLTAPPEGNFEVPSLTELKRELHSQSGDTVPSISKNKIEEASKPPQSYTDPFEPPQKNNDIDPVFATSTKTTLSHPKPTSEPEELTKTSKKALPDSVSRLNEQWQADAADSFPPKFKPNPQAPKSIPSIPAAPTYPDSPIPNLPQDLSKRSQAALQFDDLLASCDVSRFIERSKQTKNSNNPPLPDTFKKAFQNWYRLKDPLKSPKGETLLWEFIQAIWSPSPQKEVAVFLTQTNLAHQNEGLWGTFLDGLIAAKYYRKVVFEIRQKILRDPNIRWTRVGLPRLNTACSALGFQKLTWKEQEGMDQLCRLLSRQFSLNEFLVVP